MTMPYCGRSLITREFLLQQLLDLKLLGISSLNCLVLTALAAECDLDEELESLHTFGSEVSFESPLCQPSFEHSVGMCEVLV